MTQTLQALHLRQSYKWWVFGAVAVGMFVSVMDQTALNIAIPRIASAFDATIPAVQWVVLGYILAISAFMLPMGRVADMTGRTRVYITGFLIFAGGGLLAALSPNLGVVIALKAFQGVGTAMTQATSMAIVTSAFPAEERGKAIGLVITMVGVGAIAGPVIGGGVVELLGWQALFLMAVPLGAISAFVGLLILRNNDQATQTSATLRGFDYPGAALSTIALIGFLLIMSFGYRIGWASPAVLGGFLAVSIALALFVIWERRFPQPLMPLELFRRPVFTLGIAAYILAFMGSTALFFLMPFYLQEVQGYSPGESGLIMIAVAVCMAALGPLAGRYSDRFGTRPFTVAGLAMSTTAFLFFTRLHEASSLTYVVLTLLLAGMGMAVFSSPNSSSILGAVERERYGVTTAFLNLTRNAGNIIGLALATTIVTATMAARGFEPSLSVVSAAGGEAAKGAFAQGFSYAFLLAAAFTSIALVLSILKPRERPSPH